MFCYVENANYFDVFENCKSTYVYGGEARIGFYVLHDSFSCLKPDVCVVPLSLSKDTYACVFDNFGDMYLCFLQNERSSYGFVFAYNTGDSLFVSFDKASYLPVGEKPFIVLSETQRVFWDLSLAESISDFVCSSEFGVSSCVDAALLFFVNMSFGIFLYDDVCSSELFQTDFMARLRYLSSVFRTKKKSLYTEILSSYPYNRVLGQLDNGYMLLVPIEIGQMVPDGNSYVPNLDNHICVLFKSFEGTYWYFDERGLFGVDEDYILNLRFVYGVDNCHFPPWYSGFLVCGSLCGDENEF